MKKGKTRILALALALLCVCGTAACSSKEGETSSAAEKTSSAGSAASSKQANAKPSGELTQESLKSYPVTPESQFETEDVSGGVSVTWCYSEDAVVVVPKTIKGKPVVEIGGQGMKALPTCRGIVLPDSVEIIKFDAFCADENLECIDLGKSLKTIEFGAFDDCNKLKTVTFPDGLESISEGDKNGIFFVSSALHEVYIPASTTKIGNVLMHKDCPNAVIVTPAGSAAEKWAKANNVPVKNQKLQALCAEKCGGGEMMVEEQKERTYNSESDEHGAVIIEATLSLSFFMFAIFTLLSVVSICYAQARINTAVDCAELCQ